MIFALAALLALVVVPAGLPAQAQTEVVTMEEAKSILVTAILRNTTWPDEAGFESFTVGHYGDDPALLAALTRSMEGTRIRGKPVAVIAYESLPAARSAHMLIVAAAENSRLPAIWRELEGSRTLLVSDGAAGRDHAMVNFTYPSKSRVAFEINARNFVLADLTPSREILMFGGSKLDLADIYEETEQKLAQARAVAAEQQGRLQAQQRQLAEQEDTIARQLEEMAANRDELLVVAGQLANVQRVLRDSERRLEGNAAALREKEAILAAKEERIARYSQRIEQNLARLEAQERQIEEQDSVLVSQLSTIESQRFILVAIAAVLLLVLLLIALTFRAYRSKHRLALELEGRTEELGVANEKLLEMTEAKSRFLSTMSHEIRTPMNGVIGMAELLEDTALSDQQREYLSLILKSADTLLGLINDVLDFSKIEAGHLELERIPFHLREVLGDTLQTLALRADEKDLELTYRIPPEVPDYLLGDPLRLRQVIVNLVGNAIKFTSAGEVVVELGLESGADPARLRFEVRDTGIGISPAQQARIFDAFGQADSSTTRQFGGTGLGLSIAGQLVEMMGGELAVRSEEGSGSTFYFTASFSLPAGPAPQPLQPEALRGLRALVVDDNDTNRLILEELLGNWGMSVTAAEGGAQALAAIDAADRAGSPFAVALLDVMMPLMDGFELAAKLRERHDRRDLRILMLTSASRANTEATRERLGISRVLIKPTKHSDLQLAITDALSAVTDAPAAEQPAPMAVQPRRVLLVEDNPVNRRVATEVLQKRGHQIEIAADGRQAVALSAKQDFDLVLMDVHMPVMDGLTATRIIREREHGSGAHLPIIALTAGATVEDRENSLSAGMDGFLSKPFRAGDLVKTVETAAGTGAAGIVPAPVPPAQGDDICLDWEGALRNLEGDSDFLGELGEMFLAQYPGMLAAVQRSAAAGEGDELQRSAHALKGSAQVIGGRAVAATARELEALGRAGRTEEAAAAVTQLEAQLGELAASLRGALPAQPA